MTNGIAISPDISQETVLRDCLEVLHHVARYRLPPALDRRLLWLSENKETLTEEEREELLELVEFGEERTVEKLQARVILKHAAVLWPHLGTSQP